MTAKNTKTMKKLVAQKITYIHKQKLITVVNTVLAIKLKWLAELS